MQVHAALKNPELKNLKEEKRQWNMLVKLLMAKLKVFRSGLNGRGSKEVGLESIRISNQFPSSYTSYLNSIADDYVAIVSGARQIMQRQNELSSARTSGKVSQASWWGSRMWARISLLSLGKEQRTLRLRMISAAQESAQILKLVEDHFLQKGLTGLKEATIQYVAFARIFTKIILISLDKLSSLMAKPIVTYKANIEQPEATDLGVNERGGSLEQETNELESTEDLSKKISDLNSEFEKIRDALTYLDGKIDPLTIKHYDTSLNRIEKSFLNLTRPSKAMSEKEQLEIYADIVDRLSLLESYIKGDFDKIKAKASNLIGEDITKLAQNVVSRYIKRKLLESSPKQLEQLKLNILESVYDLQKHLGSYMDMLENKDTTFNDIDSESKRISNLIVDVGTKIGYLAETEKYTSDKSNINRELLVHLKRSVSDIQRAFEDEEV